MSPKSKEQKRLDAARMAEIVRSLTDEELNLMVHVVIDFLVPATDRIVPKELVEGLAVLLSDLFYGVDTPTPKTKPSGVLN